MTRQSLFRDALPCALIAGAVALLSACQEPVAAPSQEETLPEVGVQQVRLQPVTDWVELPGRVLATRSAEVRPQVNGLIQRRLFEEGSEVRAGQVLFEIDDGAYRGAVEQAQAQLQRAEVRVDNLGRVHGRQEELLAQGMVSRQAHEDSAAAIEQARAERDAARAALAMARVNLERSKVRAPIAGRIGRALASEGALVVASQELPLARIVQLDPVLVDVIQPSVAEGSGLSQRPTQGRAHAAVPVRLRLDGGRPYAHAGEMLFSEPLVDAATGAVTLRARVPNPQSQLMPGMFVRAVLPRGHWEQAVVLPFAALQALAPGRGQVLLVGEGLRVEPREVLAIAQEQGHWLVHGGLKEGEQVLIEGLRRVSPGQRVRPVVLPVSGVVAGASAGASSGLGAQP